MKRKQEHVRLQNLEILIAEAGSAAELARRAGTNSSYLSQVRRQMLTPNGTPRGVGDDLAAKLECGMGKPDGWMDDIHYVAREETPPVYGVPKPGPDTSLYPLLAWEHAAERSKIGGKWDGDTEAWLPCPVVCSNDAFVLRVIGVSMEPKFHAENLIFVDPHISPIHGKYVVVQLGESNEATFRQLIVEEKRQYLKALNPDWPNRIIEIDAAAMICGVVVFKGELV